jgi:hypothetical protein
MKNLKYYFFLTTLLISTSCTTKNKDVSIKNNTSENLSIEMENEDELTPRTSIEIGKRILAI